MRTGIGYDVHRLVAGRELWLGGIKIDFELGLEGHSDADVLIHAICDALLGAAGLRDIGYYFPDNSAEFKNIDSKILLQKTINLIRSEGFEIENIDSIICAEKPKISPFIDEMKNILSNIIKIPQNCIGIKATTTEKLGFVGRSEGISAHAAVLLK
jgi:2-C-methyl-D-erythritol 2,4-cyclodiphosphate synthase